MGKKFGDIPRGIFIVRGENVVLLGEIVSGTVLVLFLCVCVCVCVSWNYTDQPATTVGGE